MGSLVKWNKPVTPTFSRLFDDFFVNDFPTQESGKFSLPSVNIKEQDDSFAIEVAAPGLKRDQFNINIEEDVMTISYEDSTNEEEKGDNYTRKEFTKSSFLRRFTLPETVNADKVDAKYKDGILHITLPKREEAKPKPAIAVKVK